MVQKLELPIALKSLPKEKKSILICRIDLEKVQESGKGFRWKNPGSCPKCNNTRLWGHGYVLRYFFGFTFGLWMKRWRCPECGSVHTARPKEYTPGMQYPTEKMRESLKAKLLGKPFLKTIPRQNQQHWIKTFLYRCRERSNWNDGVSILENCNKFDQLPVTKRRIYSVNWPAAVIPYLPFAVTVKKPHFKLE